ncbi:MAG: hypothetical protein ACYDBJ_15775 [Aggregatilineales bacterium]
MDIFERLTQAENELAFFVILCNLLNDDYTKNAYAELHSRWDTQHGFFVELPIHLDLSHRDGPPVKPLGTPAGRIRQLGRVFDKHGQRTATCSMTTNTFTLREDGRLIRQLHNQPSIHLDLSHRDKPLGTPERRIVGLRAIQAELRKLQQTLEAEALPETTRP